MTHYPFVSILMPIRNEEHFIERSLGAILAQTYPSDCIEILIADGMSTDNTRTLIQQMQGKHHITIVDNPEKIQAFGLNHIIPLAKGDFLIRIDGHTLIASHYVEKCVETLQITQADNVGGPMNPVGVTTVGKAIAAAGKSPFAVPTAFHVSATPQWTDTVYLGAWPQSVFKRIGLYNTQVGVNEDYELNVRIRNTGGKIYFTPEIQSEYYGRQTLSALAKQYYRYGRSRVRTLKKHPQSLKPRHLIAPLFVIGLLTGAVLSLVHPLFFTLWALGILAYSALNIAFSIKTMLKSQLSVTSAVYLPLVFLVIHLTWGSGFLIEWVAPKTEF